MTKRTNKTQRMAWNLTKLASTVDMRDTSNGLYELGTDAGMAFIDGTGYGLNQFVVVPQKVWDEAKKNQEQAERYGVEAGYLIRTVERWYRDAMAHRF